MHSPGCASRRRIAGSGARNHGILFGRLVRSRWLGIAGCALGPLIVAAERSVAQAEPLRVEVSGVTGDVRRNVLAVLAIAQAAKDGKVTPDRIRELHEQAERDIDLALEPFGYYRPKVEPSLAESQGAWIARYVIDPGPAVLVRDVRVTLTGEGADSPAFRKAVARFPVHPGDTLRHLPYEAGKLTLLTVATDSGYLDAKFDSSEVRVDRTASTADIVVDFDTGPHFEFGPVQFDQNVLDPKLLRALVPFRQGDPYHGDKLLQLQAAIAERAYWSRIEVIPRRDLARGREVPIEVQLVPRKAREYQVGGGYGTDTGPRGRLAIQWRRINRHGHMAGIELTGSPIQQSISGQYQIPAVATPRGTLTFVGGYSLFNPSVSSSKTILAGVRLTRPRLGWNESLSLTYHHEAFSVGLDTGTTNLLIAGASWDQTRSNDPVFPTKGMRVRLNIQGSRRGILAASSFLQIEGTLKLIRSIAPGTRVLFRADVGRTFSDDFRRLPPTLRFFAGGSESVRGFGFYSLGPRDAVGNVIGGRTLEVASLEVDHRIFNRWAVAAFTDVGDALDNFTLSIGQGALEQGVGAGVRWVSPIGLIRLDGAFAVSRPGAPFYVHFSLGPDL